MSNTIKEILEMLFQLVIIPAIPILAGYAVKALKEWSLSKTAEIENKTIARYLDEITDIVSQAVVSTTQTYVDSLKAQGKFDSEAQRIAFEKTKDTVIELLAQDAVDFLAEMYGDVDLWLDTKIEQMVNETKDQKAVLIAEA